jgi:hypothetical protein
MLGWVRSTNNDVPGSKVIDYLIHYLKSIPNYRFSIIEILGE